MDEDLVDRIIGGDGGAFEDLVNLYQVKVIATCYRFVRDKLDAQDVAQEVFIEIHRSIAKFRKDSKLSTWIYRIAVSKSLDFLRKKNRKKRYGILKSILDPEVKYRNAASNITENPEMLLESNEKAKLLQEALDKLPKNQRVAITLSKIENFSNSEIAEIIGTTVSAVDSLIHRGKLTLQKELVKKLKNIL
jgi:RNA polymerase sigma-70 factor (ECF subfamily)